MRTLPMEATVNPQIVVIRAKKVSKSFFGYLASYNVFQSQVRRTVVGGALPTLSQKEIAAFRVPVPLDRREQNAIAAALNDADDLIDSLEQLIEKKRLIKQGAMQDLLSGRRRLEGFTESWQTKQFDQVLLRCNAKEHQITTSEYQHIGRYPIVDQGQKHVVGYSDREDRRFHCPGGGVLVFGDHTCIVKFIDHDFVVGADGTQILVAKKGHCTRFLAYQLLWDGVIPTGYNRHFKELKQKSFLVPSPSEQEEIAKTVGDMDAELAALEARLAKARQIKQGMMQELLTGRIRLV